MTDYSQPLDKHCEGCDEDRLDVRPYRFTTPGGHYSGTANWCLDCKTIAEFNGPVGALDGGNYTVEELDADTQ